MYRTFYGLTKRPFHTTPDPDFLFLTPSHQEALAAIIYGIEQMKGFIAITGEVGVGKTTILRSYLNTVDGNRNTTVVYIYYPTLTFTGLLTAILRELGQEPVLGEEAELVRQLQHYLIEEYRKNRIVVVIIDEAQNMPIPTLEHLRMLTNLETSTDKLLQIVLIGQPELETLLDRHELRQLRQRIAVQARINPLSPRESYQYIQHRLTRAGRHGTSIFTKSAIQLIIRHGGGIPRQLNILCDNILLTGFGCQQHPISSDLVREVTGETPPPTSNRWKKWGSLAAGILLTLGIGWFMTLHHPEPALPVSSEPIPQAIDRSPDATDQPSSRSTPLSEPGLDTGDSPTVNNGSLDQ